MLHTIEEIWLLDANGDRAGSATTRIAVPGGWLYRDGLGPPAPRMFVPDPMAEHVRDARRLKLREGARPEWEANSTLLRYCMGDKALITEDRMARSFTAGHADGSETDHATRLEAHDALIASGSESSFEVVTGPAVKP